MRFEPLIFWWLVVPVTLLCLAGITWQLLRIRQQGVRAMLPWIRRSGLVILLSLITLGPSIPGGVSSPGVTNLDVLFVVDTTSSMAANDYKDSKLRLKGAKQDMLALSTKLRGAHLALITFDSKVNTIVPFTPDGTIFTTAVNSLRPEVYGTSKGSAVDKPLDAVIKRLKDGQAAHPDRSRLIFYLGDGEQTADAEKIKSFDGAARYVDGGAVLGYGTARGSKVLRYTGIDNLESLDTKSNPQYVNALDTSTGRFVPAVSKLDETALKEIAGQLSVPYQNRNNADPIDTVLQESKAQFLIDKDRQITHYLNLYWLVAIPFTILLFWEWWRVTTLMIELRRSLKRGEKHAS